MFQFYANFNKENLISEFNANNIYEITESKNELEFWLAAFGPSRVMDKLIKTAGDGKRLQCHRQAHTIGRGAFALYGIKAFKDGDASCSSGFYHGVMEGYIKQKTSSNVTDEITTRCGNFETALERIHCFHGAGHGLLVYYSNDLPKAVNACDALSKEYGKGPCMTGAFMENIVIGTTVRYHTTKWLAFDPHFPCTEFIDQSFALNQCYQMQTTWMTYIYKNDYDRIFTECSKAPQAGIASCYQGFGKDWGLHVFRDPEKILSYCNKLSDNKEYYDACIKGGLYDILDFWGFQLQDQGKEFCDQVLPLGKEKCFKEIEQRKKNLTRSL